jgi:hypothetical protein
VWSLSTLYAVRAIDDKASVGLFYVSDTVGLFSVVDRYVVDARCYEYKPVANAAIIAVRVDLTNTQDDEDSQVNQLNLVQFLMA